MTFGSVSTAQSIRGTVWASGRCVPALTVYTVRVSRWYKKDGQEGREYTSVLGFHDLPNASIVQMKAHNWIRKTISKEEEEPEEQESEATGTDG